jgi:hypothetical protein
MARFPRADINDVKANDPMMKRVDMNNGEIGSRPKEMPKEIRAGMLSISHVGGSGQQTG